MNKYVDLCKQRGVNYSDESNIAILADFLCKIADSSKRPDSLLKGTLAAISFLFESMGKSSPSHNPDIKRLVTALTKSGTTRAMIRQRPMPITSFKDLFCALGLNESLSIKNLRMKTVTLLALVLMTRPSDLAPKAKLFDPKDMSLKSVAMSLNDLDFNEDGSLTVRFWGIKNDTNRQGFEVNLPRNEETIMDHSQCLKCYVDRTVESRPKETLPVCISLKAPYKAISSDTIGNVLEYSIKMAGLSDQGFSAKSFRPTGATNAVTLGILPETVMKIGRWKTREVFFNHYVYGQVPKSHTSSMLEGNNQ